MSRTKKATKNILFSLLSSCLSLILTLVNRKVILSFMGSEMLGYESLFANIFSVLSLTEMGAGTVIAYQLYTSVANKDEYETNILISMYKFLYRIIGIIVCIIGVIFFFFLQYIVTDYTASFQFIQKIYLIQLIATICSYFLSYRRMLFISDQKEYVITKIDMLVNFITQILKILAVILFKNYIIYLLISVCKEIVVNIIVHITSRKNYQNYKYIHVKKEDFQKRRIFKDMFNFVGQKISSTIYYNTDNILISMLLGVSTVGIYSNYYVIKNQVFRLTTKIFNPIQASIGNFINDSKNDINDVKKLFDTLDVISFSFALIFSCCLYNLIQPFVSLWYGKEYLISNLVVILIVINAYMETLREIPYYFRSAFGEYEKDRKYVTFGAIANIILTICLGKTIGLIGVLIGTVVGMFFLWYGVVKFLYSYYFKLNILDYYFKHLKLGLISFITILGISIICNKIPITLIGLIIRAILCLFISIVIIYLVYHNKDEYKNLILYVKKILKR